MNHVRFATNLSDKKTTFLSNEPIYIRVSKLAKGAQRRMLKAQRTMKHKQQTQFFLIVPTLLFTAKN